MGRGGNGETHIAAPMRRGETALLENSKVEETLAEAEALADSGDEPAAEALAEVAREQLDLEIESLIEEGDVDLDLDHELSDELDGFDLQDISGSTVA